MMIGIISFLLFSGLIASFIKSCISTRFRNLSDNESSSSYFFLLFLLWVCVFIPSKDTGDKLKTSFRRLLFNIFIIPFIFMIGETFLLKRIADFEVIKFDCILLDVVIWTTLGYFWNSIFDLAKTYSRFSELFSNLF